MLKPLERIAYEEGPLAGSVKTDGMLEDALEIQSGVFGGRRSAACVHLFVVGENVAAKRYFFALSSDL